MPDDCPDGSVPRPIRVGLFQRVVPEYRVGVFSLLARQPGIRLTIYAGSFSEAPDQTACRRCREVRFGPFRLHPGPLLAAFRREQDVMICEGRVSLLTSVLLVLLGHRLGVGCVWWTSMHRSDGSIDLRRGLPGWLTRLAIRRARAVLTYGRLAAAAVERAGVDHNRVFVACNSLDTDRLRQIERSWRATPARLGEFMREHDLIGRSVILYVGRLVRSKRVDWLFDALERLASDSPVSLACLVIVGDGPDRPRLASEVRRRRLDSRVIFAGEIRDPEMSCPYFLAARVLAMPGTGGLAINQALTFGLPVVVAGGDGTEHDAIEDGVNGHRVVPENPESFTQVLRRIILADNRHWAEMSAAARASVDRGINSEAMIKGMLDAIRSATPGRKRVKE